MEKDRSKLIAEKIIDNAIEEKKKQIKQAEQDSNAELDACKIRCEEKLLNEKDYQTKLFTEKFNRLKEANENRQQRINLKIKNEIINQIFDETKEMFLKMPKSEYKEFLSEIIKNNCRGKEQIFVSKSREDDKKLIESLAVFKEKELTIGGAKNISGGIIIENKNEELDFSIDGLVEEKKENLILEINKKMFN